MMEKSTIRVVRDEDFFGMARKLKVFIDDKHVTDLKYNQGININVSPGLYKVQVKMDWCTCKPEEVQLDAGEKVELQVETGFDESIAKMFNLLYNLFFNASEFFTLKRL